ELPLSRSEISTVVLEPDASALAIPGGMLIAVVPSSYGYFAGSMLAAIDSDGSVRWIRCFSDAADGVYAAPTETNPSSAYVLFAKDAPDHSELPTFRIDRLSLADGAVTGTVADMAAAQGVHLDPAVTWRPVAQSATSLLFGPASAAGTTPDLVRFDVATGVATDVPYPPSTGANRYFGFDDDGDVVLLAENNTTSFNSIFLDGEWVTDDAAVAAAGAQAVRVDFALDPSDSALHGYDATGKVLWSQPAIVSTNGEGFRAATSNGVTLVRGCTSYDFETGAGCKGAGLWGVDPLTGNVTWHLDGRRQVSAVADGFALVTEPIAEDGTGGAWIMIDVTTGEPVDESQRWVDPSTFDSQCCGGGESVYVKAEGGIVFAANGDHVAVWYPKAASIPTVTVTLP
ncbi:MAG: hypothetical protein JWL72_2231, partial [Ilumatobacteraceae bacterium]|nr:hypothetical protein [Ilumatobacteraceae bacterium]